MQQPRWCPLHKSITQAHCTHIYCRERHVHGSHKNQTFGSHRQMTTAVSSHKPSYKHMHTHTALTSTTVAQPPRSITGHVSLCQQPNWHSTDDEPSAHRGARSSYTGFACARLGHKVPATTEGSTEGYTVQAAARPPGANRPTAHVPAVRHLWRQTLPWTARRTATGGAACARSHGSRSGYAASPCSPAGPPRTPAGRCRPARWS